MNTAQVTVEDLVETEPDALAGHEKEAHSLTRKLAAVLLVGVVPVMGWMAFAPLSSAVVAGGFVKVDSNRHTLQHAEGGIVKVVHVRDGQKVKAGQPLLELGDVAVSAEFRRLTHRLLAERAGVMRLEAEQARAPSLQWPAAFLAEVGDDAALKEQLAKEQSLFAARRTALDGQSALLREQKARIAQEMSVLESQLAHAKASMAAQRREYENNATLVKDGFVTGARLLQLEAGLSDYSAKVEERRGDQVRAEQRIADLDIRLRGLENEYRQQASDQLKLALPRIQEIEQELRKARDMTGRQIIASPADGEVMGLKFTHEGAVVAPREPLVEIVPKAARLLVEARIRTDDINRVEVGRPASVRFTAYKARQTGMTEGEVAYVSPDRQVDPQTGQSFYTVHVAVDSERANQHLQGRPLTAGMPAELYIEGEQRTPLRYLLEPVTQALRHAGREH